jgi:hypothetical protein
MTTMRTKMRRISRKKTKITERTKKTIDAEGKV